MIRVPVLAISSLLLLSAVLACSTGGVSLRADGSPGPEECPKETLKLMRFLRMGIGDAADVELDLNQADTSPITLYDGPIESELTSSLGIFHPPTRLYGRVWTGGPQVVIRYYEARPPDGDITPICAVARLARGQMKKLPGSLPGTAIVEFSSAGVWVVDSFR
ncbi:serine/threonine protein kinase [Pyxidicoccus parkwayensis]|uniref:Serine/threonine protein kinase n=2 Tax=Pyxidicoccus parkwayensis TaxID=2813578 RepID=A0ABX7NM46_9BACT|nr:serine/threonine protein kinase [Pyxidicoccus parkwaysis]